MKRYSRVTLTAIVLAIGASLCSMTLDAHAGFVMTLDDLSAGGVEIIIADNSPIGTPTAKGLSNTADQGPLVGSIAFIGVVGVFDANVTAGISKPLIGPARIDLSSRNVTTFQSPISGSATLNIMLTDTDFLLPGQPANFTLHSSIGGTTDGTITASQEVDPNNAEFGIGAPQVSHGPFAGGQDFSFSEELNAGVATGAGPFSLTENVDITHTGTNQTSSFDYASRVVPEPSASLLLGIGLLGGLAGLRLRRRNRS